MTSSQQATIPASPAAVPPPAMFDIKVALVGPISSGKTTVLNALLGDDYGLVQNTRSDQRTCKEIVFYRLSGSDGPPARTNNIDSHASLSFADTASYYPRSNISSVVAPEVRLAERERMTAIQQSVLVQQQTNISNNSTSIPERHTDVRLQQGNLFEMRPDTQMVLVDIPGLDSTNLQECPYANYVQTHWESFDCLLIVLDVTARPKDQELTLQFIKNNLEDQTRLPVLCLWNKLDDPEDPKSLQIIQQTQSLIGLVLQPQPPPRTRAIHNAQTNGEDSIPFSLPEYLGSPNTFGPPLIDTEIQEKLTKTSASIDNPILSTPAARDDPNTTTLAIPPPPLSLQPPLLFLPVSAKEALVYKRVSHMTTLHEFVPLFEQDWMVERLSRDQIGLRKWNRMSRDDQLQESFALLQDPSEYARALQECGYTKFQDALADLVGNRHDAQTLILETRMELSLRALLEGNVLPQATSLLAPQLYSVVTKFQVLYGSTQAANDLPQQLQTAFWAAYDKMENNALKVVVEQGPLQIRALAEPLEQLLSYQTVSKLLQWQSHSGGRAEVNAAKRMRQIVVQFFQLLFEKESRYDYEGWGSNFQAASTKRGAQQHDKNNKIHTNNEDPWMALSPKDWMHIWSSLLLLGYDRHFCQHYVREKLLMEELLDKAKSSWKSYQDMPLRICPHCAEPLQPFKNEWRCEPCRFAFFTCFPTTACNGCKHRFDEYDAELHRCDNGYTYSTQQALHGWMRTFYDRSQQLVPTYPKLYLKVAVLGDIPESLANPNHIGHVLYQSCHLNSVLLEQ